MDVASEALVSVADVIGTVVNGQEVLAFRFHKPPVGRVAAATYFPEGTTLDQANTNRQELEKPVPLDVLGVNLSWDVALRFLGYDERCGRTADFTLWTDDWVVRHVWVGAGGPVSGGQVLRLMCLPRFPELDDSRQT